MFNVLGRPPGLPKSGSKKILGHRTLVSDSKTLISTFKTVETSQLLGKHLAGDIKI